MKKMLKMKKNNLKQKKIPMRKCVGCFEQKPKSELLRIVRNKSGNIDIDITGKAQGRGAYICNNLECLKKAEKKKALNRSFTCEVDNEIFKKLYIKFSHNIDE